MNTHEIKKQTQTILGDGVVGVVGCGRFSAEGLSGMYDLAEHLISSVPSRVPTEAKKPWSDIEYTML